MEFQLSLWVIFTNCWLAPNKQIKLSVNTNASDNGSRIVTVVPTNDERKLMYYNWVESNYKRVNKATNGRVGYIHIPNIGSDGLNEFVKHYYAQLDRMLWL